MPSRLSSALIVARDLWGVPTRGRRAQVVGGCKAVSQDGDWLATGNCETHDPDISSWNPGPDQGRGFLWDLAAGQ
jgi:hypothetical protein